jgi:hypothetical protein
MLNAELRPGLVKLEPADEATKLLLPAMFAALLATPAAKTLLSVPPRSNALSSAPSAESLPTLTARLPKPGVPRSLPAKAPVLGMVLLPTLTARFPKSFWLVPASANAFLPTASVVLKLPVDVAVAPLPTATESH